MVLKNELSKTSEEFEYEKKENKVEMEILEEPKLFLICA